MLKIKDSVDLKELEKFGFKKYCNYGYGIELNNCSEILIDKINDDYILCFNLYNYDFNEVFCELNIIYDLIQAGLVEKVEE